MDDHRMSHTSRMNRRIPPDRADELFFYAKRVVADDEGWRIDVDPAHCLTGYADEVDVAYPLRELGVDERRIANGRTVYEGRIPFSAGVVLLVEGTFVMLYRDADAPSDPCKWTSPAGRCDHDPTQTAYRELYEELLVRANGRPAVVEVGDESAVARYETTLRERGFDHPREQWLRLPASVPDRYDSLHVPVETHYGDERHVGRFWPYWDDAKETLELRTILEIQRPGDGPSLSFSDPEYGRRVEQFTLDDLLSLSSDELVPANAALREEIS
ncbi:NUDIX hydrolase [Haloarculaceae archaeon H-GB2-1]|nr:NUDIX hydrolase [Haloarculaceae archaeon H-GB1-1]MEA5388975.1 NUDIX hydrolase [Haloarculaceae archaeon H-GB11]MEA5407033.1 NUDIX hydrolase [Haloarculaceae archaeon H-GB2-1]